VMPTEEEQRLRLVLRRERLAARAALNPAYRAAASQRIFTRIEQILAQRGAQTVGAYLPIRHEPDSLPWIELFSAAGGAVALPVVVDRDQPLAFCPWIPGHALEPGPLGTAHPAAHDAGAVTIQPEVLIVPVVAFDEAGYRLGYGGGFYDRTMASAAYSHGAVIGVAFEISMVPTIHPQPHDQRMHRIVTEAEDRVWDGIWDRDWDRIWDAPET
jgi:5-formyltetrahydrofolate cyclo-ligase